MMTVRRARRLLAGLANRSRLPRRTVRLRLTLLYGSLFLVSGAALLAMTFILVNHATNGFTWSAPGGISGSYLGGGSGLSAARQKADCELANPIPDVISPCQAQALAQSQRAAALHQLLVQSGIALGAMAVLSILLGWLVAGRVLRPLRTITAAALEISASSLHQRLALDGPDDELKELADTFDGLLARLEASFQAQRQFIANASHELRTPLARQRVLSQVAVADPDASVASLRQAHERVLASGVQQERLIEALLTLARGQAGLDRREPFDLAAVLGQVLADRRAEAEYLGLTVDAALSPAVAAGDPRLAERLATNLVDNALRHNAANGRIVVETATRDGRAVLRVTNTGPDIPATAIPRLFQPFQRLGGNRTGHHRGVGLGLSIVRAIADAHGASAVARPRPGGGLRVDVVFPASASTPASPGGRADRAPAGATAGVATDQPADAVGSGT